MTGYGSGESVNKGFKILVELSSVNRRQAEVALSLPSELDSLESDIRKTIFLQFRVAGFPEEYLYKGQMDLLIGL